MPLAASAPADDPPPLPSARQRDGRPVMCSALVTSSGWEGGAVATRTRRRPGLLLRAVGPASG